MQSFLNDFCGVFPIFFSISLLYKSINLFSITNKAKIIMAEIKGTSITHDQFRYLHFNL